MRKYKTFKRWTPDEEAHLREIYITSDPADLSRIFGRDYGAIMQRALRLGLKRPRLLAEKACEFCGKSFRYSKARDKHTAMGRVRFCSLICSRAALRKGIYRNIPPAPRQDVPCSNCSKPTSVLVSRIIGNRSYFCSSSCRKEFKESGRWSAARKHGKRGIYKCCWCGKDVERLLSAVRGQNIFCSHACNGAFSAKAGGKVSQLERDFAVALSMAGAKFKTQYPVKGFSVDIAFPERKIAVEVDGTYWHSLPKMKERDRRKDAALRDIGWEVVRVTEELIRSDLENAVKKVLESLR